jgi:hypothetical protein
MMNTTGVDTPTGSQYQPGSDARGLLKQYVSLCNQAITENRDKFWMKQAKQLNEKLWNGGNFRTIIYDQDPGAVIEEATVQFDQHGPSLRVLPPGDYAVTFSWKVPIDYLEEVLAQPQAYLDNPLKLDWDWMKERVRDEASYRLDSSSLVAGVALGAVAGMVLSALFSKQRRKSKLPDEFLASVRPLESDEIDDLYDRH